MSIITLYCKDDCYPCQVVKDAFNWYQITPDNVVNIGENPVDGVKKVPTMIIDNDEIVGSKNILKFLIKNYDHFDLDSSDDEKNREFDSSDDDLDY